MLIEDAEQKLYELAETGKYGSGFEPFTTALTDAIDMAANAYRRDGGLSGLATGFTDLDGKMGGLQPSDLIIVAGRPSMGKTALATNIAYHVAQTIGATHNSEAALDGAVVGFFSLEMSAEQLATRIISEQSYIPSERIRRGRIEPRSSIASSRSPRSSRTCLSISTRPAASPWPSSPRGRGA